MITHDTGEKEYLSDDKEYNKQFSGNNTVRGRTAIRIKIPPPGAGIWLDLNDKLRYYWSDWKDSWDYRVLPALLDTYFSNLLPALAFAQDMSDRTDNSYGVNEVLLSSAMAGIVFGIFAGQPLCIVGVTGPISILTYTIYGIVEHWNTNYFGFMFWVYIWSMVLHILLAISNAVALLQYVTSFPCDIFGLFNNVIYIQKGIQVLSRQFEMEEEGQSLQSGFASVVVSICMVVVGLIFKNFHQTPFFNQIIRTFISDYSTPLSVLFWSAFVHFGGRLNAIEFQKLHITRSFHPTSNRGRDQFTWLAYHPISVRDVFIALPFGIIVTLLFYFDHNVSSLMAQKYQYKLRKPASFHYDFLLLGVTTGISGVLGIPPPNGLLPQAPLHTEALLVYDADGKVVRCVEQRFTNTFQGLMMIGTMTGPLLVCLGEIPQAVLSGLFFTMGIHGLMYNTIVRRLCWIFTEHRLRNANSSLRNVSVNWLMLFVCFSLVGFAGEVAITNTVAAILFPIVLLLTIIFSLLLPFIVPNSQLILLEQNVAQEFTLKNLHWAALCDPWQVQ